MTSFYTAFNDTLSKVANSLESFGESIVNATDELSTLRNTVMQKLEDNNYDSQGSVTGGIEYIRESAVKTLVSGYTNFLVGMAITLGILLVMLLLYLHYVCSGHTRK